MTMRIGIFGTSGFAREVGDIAIELNYTPIFIAHNQTEFDNWEFTAEVILESDIDRHSDMPFAIGVGENSIRERIARRFSEKINFCNLIHPSATFGHVQRHAIENKNGIVICAGARLTNNIDVGNFSIVNLNATIGHDTIIEDFVNIAPGANISGNVHLGSRCWIGTGAVINQGNNEEKLHIGHDTTIGSGSVVVKSCEPNAVYVGIPAKRLK